MSPSTHKIELNADVRTITGGKVAALRRSGFVPAVLYGKGQEPISLQVPSKDFIKTFKEAGESTLVYINIEGKSYPTIIHDVARHPHSNAILHADFYKVRLDEKIKTNVPIVFTGEAPAVKDFGAIFVRNINELEVEALPQNLPHELSIDISILKQMGDKITIADLKKGLGSLASLTTEDDEAIIAMAQEPISEEELQKELEATTSIDDVEVVEKEKKEEVVEEGETPAPTPAPEDKTETK